MALLTFPASPVTNQTYVSGGQSWTYDGKRWNPMNPVAGNGATGLIGVAVTAPAGPGTGALWLNSDSGDISVYTGTGWVAIGSISPISLATGYVQTNMIADTAVTTAKLADVNVTTGKLANSSVTTAKIADTNVTTAKLDAYAVTTAKIANYAVTAQQIANNTITASQLAAGAAVPSQSGQTGKFLTTDGTNASWTTVTTTPADGSITAAKLGLGTTYLPMAVGNTAQRPGSPATGFTRINSETNYLETYYNSNWIGLQYLGLLAASSSGATTTTIGNYRILTYNTSGTFTVTDAPVGSNVEVLLIGGGGAGGTGYSGGGGAGGYYYSATMSVPVGTYSVILGAGASSSSVTLGVGSSGASTSFNGQTALGGGGGGEYNSSATVKASNGGSGGGAGGIGTTSASIGTGTSTQGSNGGTAIGSSTSTAFGGGGGGAGAVGSNAAGTVAGSGGVGVANPITGSTVGQNVSSVYYVAGGGGGGGGTSGTAGSGGSGGGGAGILSAHNNLLPLQLTFATGWTYSNASQVNTNSIAPDGSATATLMSLTSNASYDLYYNKTGLTSSLTYTFTFWIKLGTATNFAVAYNNTAAWNTVPAPGIKTYTAADGLNVSTAVKI